MATSNQERVGRMLEVLAKGLEPVADREFSKAYGDDWVQVVAAEKEMATGHGGPANPSDSQFLLNAVWHHWNPTLGKILGQAERNYVSELRVIRNRWAHPDAKAPFTIDDVYRAYDTTERLLTAVSAPEAAILRKAKFEVLRAGYEASTKKEVAKVAVAATVGTPLAGLRPWREVVVPHPDVASGRFTQAEFAADLAQVAAGEGAPEYVDPREFFARTFITLGLRDLLIGSLKRLSGLGGEPVVELQTNFGGGKTHSMLALYHLASGIDPRTLPGLEPILQAAGVASIPAVRRVVIVGTAVSPAIPRKRDGLEVRTLWGELAWQLGGAEGFAVVAEADRLGVSPGSDILRDLLVRFGPAVILIDEWVTFVRQLWSNDALPAGSFDANLTFAQALTTAVTQSPSSLLLASLPSSQIEIGGEGGQKALERLAKAVARQESPWRPASMEEGFEIVRRRLFQPLETEEAHAARDSVVQHFADLYARNPNDFPAATKEAAYQRRMTAAYPIHPELFDRLFTDWSTLEKFQRTRGVLKLMAAVIHSLWERNDGSLLILPGTIPLDDTRVLPQLTQYLEDNWAPIIETDVDGPSSLPLALDRENAGTLGKYSAARRVARTIFLGSAPNDGSANRGIDDQRIRLGCVQPGESPPTFGDALRRLSDRAAHLYDNQGRYWYSTQPSVAQLARDRAAHQKSDLVAGEIEKRLRVDLADRGAFARVHPCPRSGADVPDEAEAGLVVLGPEHPHASKNGASKARDAAMALLDSRGTGSRTYRNAVVFAAADATRLVELEGAVRIFLAWDTIWTEREQLNLDAFQSNQAKTKREQADETVKVRIPETYSWVLVPGQKDKLGTVDWTEVRLQGQGALAPRAAKKLIADGLLLTQLGGVTLRYEIDRVPLWQGDDIDVKQLWDYFATYLYLPRLRDSSVLTAAIGEGVGTLLWRSETFAYAAGKEVSAKEGEPARYLGLVGGRQTNVLLDGRSMVVRPEIAAAVIDSIEPVEPTTGEYPPAPDHPPERVGIAEAGPTAVRRFHGSVSLDPTRPTPEFSRIADEIISRLSGLDGVTVRVTVEIAAAAKGDGFSDATVRTVTENARTLKFGDAGFEEE